MNQGWQKKRLGDVTTKIGSGATPRGGDESYKTEGISLIRSLNVYDDGFREAKLARIDDEQADDLSNVVVEPHDVLLNITGASVARCCRAPVDFLPARVNQHVSIIRPIQQKLDSDFLQYLLISKIYKDRLLHTGEEGGSTRQAITKAQLQEFVIEFPESLAEQQRIVGLLDEAFEGIATAKANAEKNLQNARALFESHLQSVFTQRGPGWVENRLVDVCTFINGRAYKKEEMLSIGKYPLLRVGNFFTNRDWYYSDLELDADKYCDNGDLLYAWSASFGPRVWGGGKVIYHYHIWKVLPHATVVEKRFLLHLLEWDVDEIKKAHGTGTTMMHVSKGSMESRVVPIPPLKEQAAIVSLLDDLREETQRLARLYERKHAALEALKKSLLHQAFSGEL